MTSKFVFSYTDHDGNNVTHTSNGEASWPEVVTQFIQFLRGCGYSLPNSDGYLEFDEGGEE